MTLWKESTNVLPADGATVWIRRFPGIEHPKQALFQATPIDAPTFLLVVNAPDTGSPVNLIIPAWYVHSWRPITGPSPGPGACAAQSGAGSPIGVALPAFTGQLYHDTGADTYYRSTGTTTADWTAITGTPPRGGDTFGLFSYGDSGATGAVDINDTTSIPGYDIEREPNITALNFPYLVSIDPTAIQGGYFMSYNNPSLTALIFPALTICGGLFMCDSCPSLYTIHLSLLATIGNNFTCLSNTSLTVLSLPLLTTVLGQCDIIGNTSLTTVDLSLYTPADGSRFIATNCALSIPSIEQILHRFVLAGVTTCTINLSGGTSAGLTSLSPTGQADAATLALQLTINP